MTVQLELGEAQRPWLVADVDLADGLPALPAVDGTGQPVGGAFVLIRVFTEPVAGCGWLVPDAGLSAEELGRAADAQAGRELRARLRAAGWRDDPVGLPLNGVVPDSRPAWLRGRDAAEASLGRISRPSCARGTGPRTREHCLESLQEQSYPRLTVMVVDNAPARRPATPVRGFGAVPGA